ncbi:ComEC/Rec2 family competence protein, partial [Klebsiella pneumoniae]|nr:ComEC/Rec2 family competence protein [Klebsiella pneumoniae]
LATNIGFALSAAATAGLIVVSPAWSAALRRRGFPPKVAEALAVAGAAHLLTAPVLAAVSGEVSVVAVIANVLAEPVVAPATVLGVLAT